MTITAETQPQQAEDPATRAQREHEAALVLARSRIGLLREAISAAYDVRAGELSREVGEPPQIITALDIYSGYVARQAAGQGEIPRQMIQ